MFSQDQVMREVRAANGMPAVAHTSLVMIPLDAKFVENVAFVKNKDI